MTGCRGRTRCVDGCTTQSLPTFGMGVVRIFESPNTSASIRVTLVTAGNQYRVLIRPFGAQFCFDADKAFACRKFFFQNEPANLLDPCG